MQRLPPRGGFVGESGLVCDAKGDRLELETAGQAPCLRLERRELRRSWSRPWGTGCRLNGRWQRGPGRILPLSAWEVAVKVEVKMLV